MGEALFILIFERGLLPSFYSRTPLTEEVGKYLLFLRPRRFGKSLWLTTLRNCYDIAKADKFEKLLKGKLKEAGRIPI